MAGDLRGIDPLGDHDYLVRAAVDDDEVVTIRVHAAPEVLFGIAGDNADELSIVAATVDYLGKRQRFDELPGQLGLDDVAAAYDEYVRDMRRQFATHSA
ncbi:hypothetical protein [Mycolicibacterium holsaticum]|jgi:hypothetical protein|uniref:hypothetical protein n=1 Tax=Mycolicibacterium holsaticum TaxID=152142 RepID=UPI001C7E1A09|nr:hypothetical protein [Mycolicibacterium holsaticum]MDA4110406.1 hypothetical protein [Mycolicibacterium holsaticum DSM 44478 = JCM 12374]QZA11017.1 hypothetical protein K3U96_17380 [Mycolicibacterium holsaticum DSM 44478 = JCM 12374]UNC11488.1 hypothetical protein H5U41_09450 [Mycolicibacterium holsaticum DSM 44478 = JCM 12374]